MIMPGREGRFQDEMSEGGGDSLMDSFLPGVVPAASQTPTTLQS